MNHSPSLKSVTKEFTSWRDSHSKRSYTPKLLQQQAVALKSQYSVTQIINALGINHKALKRWSVITKSSQTTSFVSLPALIPENKQTQAHELVDCKFPNGIQLKLTSDHLNADLLTVLYQLQSGERI